MKLYRFTLIFAIALMALSTALPTSAAQRLVLLEGFTQWNCPPCASWNPQERVVLDAFTRDTVVAIKYHVWWPAPNNDQFYLANTPENAARVSLYNVTGVPTTKVDGTLTIAQSQSALRNAVRNEYNNDPSPCSIQLTALAVGETAVSFSGTITAEEDMTDASMRLFVTLITDRIQYLSPPGNNGEVIFDNIFRDFWPSSSGQAFTLLADSTYTFEGTVSRNAAWVVDSLSVIAFVQTTGNRDVLQAELVEVARNYGMVTNSTDARQQIVDPASGDVTYFIDLTNIGALDDIYDVNLEGTFPGGWSHSITAIDVPPDPNHIQVPVPSQGVQTIMVTINPSGYSGAIDFDVVVTTPNEPLLSATESFRLMSGLDLLVVDDDQGGNRETWYMDALVASGTDLFYGVWDVNLSSLIANSLSGLDVVIWFTGDSWQDGTTLTASDQLMLQDYLYAGGRLFLSGQGIGFDLRTDQFFTDYLHAIYRQNYASGTNLLGIVNDPIGNELDLTITGGDGANNQIRQSSSSPDATGLSTPIFNWEVPPGQGGYPALRIETPGYRVVYLGFGFEAIDNATDRTTLMTRELDWLMGTTSADDPREMIPLEFSLGQNFPNPFNPETNIPYMLPERALVTLHVFDVLGREVATLSEGMQVAGAHAIIWNASALSSGIYFYRLEAAGGANSWSATRKFMLLK